MTTSLGLAASASVDGKHFTFHRIPAHWMNICAAESSESASMPLGLLISFGLVKRSVMNGLDADGGEFRAGNHQ